MLLKDVLKDFVFKRMQRRILEETFLLWQAEKLKYWSTPEEAFAEYKTVKEKIIEEYAERYRGQISEKVCDTMME